MAKTSKNYIRGGAKEVTFNDGGKIINLDLNLEDLNSLPVSEKGYIRLVVAQRASTDQFGNTHYVYENTFKPDASKAKGGATQAPKVNKPGYDKGHPFG